MKNTFKNAEYDAVLNRTRPAHKAPKKPNIFWRSLLRLLSSFSLAGSGFTYTTEGLEKIPKNQPCLILMNHSCFLDMPMAYKILYPRPMNIIATSDSFVGMGGLMAWLMRTIGCIPTQKFVTDISLIKDMIYCLQEKKVQRADVPGGQLQL